MPTSPRTLCVIPARGGSRSLRRKNLAELAGRPLIAHPIADALASDEVDDVFVTTDDAEIAAAAREAGAAVPFLRPPDLAGDMTTTEATLRHALLSYEEHSGHTYDVAVFLTATDVFRVRSWIDEAVRRLRENDELESVFVGHRTHKNYWEQGVDGRWMRVLPWMAEYGSRQTRRSIVREDTGLACASRAWLWRDGRRIGDRVDIIISDELDSGFDIHVDLDLEVARTVADWRNRSERT